MAVGFAQDKRSLQLVVGRAVIEKEERSEIGRSQSAGFAMDSHEIRSTVGVRQELAAVALVDGFGHTESHWVGHYSQHL